MRKIISLAATALLLFAFDSAPAVADVSPDIAIKTVEGLSDQGLRVGLEIGGSYSYLNADALTGNGSTQLALTKNTSFDFSGYAVAFMRPWLGIYGGFVPLGEYKQKDQSGNLLGVTVTSYPIGMLLRLADFGGGGEGTASGLYIDAGGTYLHVTNSACDLSLQVPAGCNKDGFGYQFGLSLRQQWNNGIMFSANTMYNGGISIPTNNSQSNISARNFNAGIYVGYLLP